MHFVQWIEFGVLVGILASAIDPGLRISRLLVAVVLGVIGALLGGVLAYLFYGLSIAGVDLTTTFVLLTCISIFLLAGRKLAKV